MKIWLDGELVEESAAKISVFDHGLLYGDGVFEGIRFYNRRVFRLEEHIKRLFDSARAIVLEIPWTQEEVCRFVVETVAANGLDDGYIRLVVTRGTGSLGLSPYLCKRASMFIIASTISLYPEEHYENGLSVITCATRRPAPAALMPQVKSLNYLNNVMAKVEAIQAGALEAVMLNEQGYVAECTGDNVFILRDGVLHTPQVNDGALDGITRHVILELADQLGIPKVERSLTRYDLFVADEFFLTGTAAEVIPVVSLDRRSIGDGKPGPLTKRFIAAFKELASTTGTPID
ncbi:MAG: branched-chain-amino-acid transaminase [Verrucomicrobia bacterium]|nr:MAG: branched-chain-amino-acid transaminase [Verrucomicrobiota bacterium]TAE86211.1 MAG: branched-chain-amino-acid transaminase [Verrucomicrobiota bacterium]TAF23657.1 MAG: branched-chain-amino-acid transaminase [Verrucomicrobiota bacterium]TAF40200.1 MAG: branched-chain-amino-acid transaminase [Verrucomicrobiota bacterium]